MGQFPAAGRQGRKAAKTSVQDAVVPVPVQPLGVGEQPKTPTSHKLRQVKPNSPRSSIAPSRHPVCLPPACCALPLVGGTAAHLSKPSGHRPEGTHYEINEESLALVRSTGPWLRPRANDLVSKLTLHAGSTRQPTTVQCQRLHGLLYR
jgi:hypothetical protein